MKTDLEAMQIMAKKDQDIRCSTDITNIDQSTKYGRVTIMTDTETAQQLMNDLVNCEDRFVVGFYVMDKTQFMEAKES